VYVRPNFKTKKELKAAVAAGQTVEAWQPGPFGPAVPDGEHGAEGPHYPEPHRWYATVVVRDGRVVKVKG
jgi:hypothetical protein